MTVDKPGCYDRAVAANTRYRGMLGSDQPYDRINSEAHRLACQEWQEVARVIGTPEFDPQLHVDRIASRWRHYAETGRTHDDLEVLAAHELTSFIAGDRVARERAAAAERKAKGLPDPEPPKKNRNPAQSGSRHAVSPPPVSPEHFQHINIDAINGVLHEFRLALGLPTEAS